MRSPGCGLSLDCNTRTTEPSQVSCKCQQIADSGSGSIAAQLPTQCPAVFSKQRGKGESMTGGLTGGTLTGEPGTGFAQMHFGFVTSVYVGVYLGLCVWLNCKHIYKAKRPCRHHHQPHYTRDNLHVPDRRTPTQNRNTRYWTHSLAWVSALPYGYAPWFLFPVPTLLVGTHYSSQGYQAPGGGKAVTHKHSSLVQRNQSTGTTTTCFPSVSSQNR